MIYADHVLNKFWAGSLLDEAQAAIEQAVELGEDSLALIAEAEQAVDHSRKLKHAASQRSRRSL